MLRPKLHFGVSKIDLTVFDENIDVKMTIIGGKIVYNNL